MPAGRLWEALFPRKNRAEFLFFFSFREYIYPELSLGLSSWPWGLWRDCFTLRKGGEKSIVIVGFPPALTKSARLPNEGPRKGERHPPAPGAPLAKQLLKGQTHICVFLGITVVPFPSSFIYQRCCEKEKRSPPHLKFRLSLNICPKNISLYSRQKPVWLKRAFQTLSAARKQPGGVRAGCPAPLRAAAAAPEPQDPALWL